MIEVIDLIITAGLLRLISLNEAAGPHTKWMTPEKVTHLVLQSRFTDENAQKQADDLGAQFTDAFIQDPEHVTLLLTLLEVLTGFWSSSRSSILLHLSQHLSSASLHLGV